MSVKIANTMDRDAFRAVDEALASADPASALAMLAERFRTEKQYPLLFEARLMRKRLELGLPLIQTAPASSFPAEAQAGYEAACIDAAREAGELFLRDGNIERAWPYFRAIGDPAPVARALEEVEPGENSEPMIQIAFQEGVHPVKGLELILKQHGMCRAISPLSACTRCHRAGRPALRSW
jgi:hypothetical protein